MARSRSFSSSWTTPRGRCGVRPTSPFYELWGDLLDQWPWLRTTETVALTPTTPGYINTETALTRFYRLQQVARNGVIHTLADPRDVVSVGNVAYSAPDATHVFLGNQLHLFPYDLTANVYVRYSSRPTAVSALATGATAIDWPEGFAMAYVYETAARALEKGDREKSDAMVARAQQVQAKLRAKLRKQQVGPIVVWTADDAREWGGI
jgi:hypothetical protein